MTENMTKFLEEAEKDEALSQALENVDSEEALIALAAEKGITLTEEDLTADELPTGELDDDDLEDVAGGMIVNPLGRIKTWVGLASVRNRRRNGRRAQTINTGFRGFRNGNTVKGTAMPFSSGSGVTINGMYRGANDDDDDDDMPPKGTRL